MTTIPMELSVKLSDVTGSGKSKMAASKLPKRFHTNPEVANPLRILSHLTGSEKPTW